jgi:hypothetical protein
MSWTSFNSVVPVTVHRADDATHSPTEKWAASNRGMATKQNP